MHQLLVAPSTHTYTHSFARTVATLGAIDQCLAHASAGALAERRSERERRCAAQVFARDARAGVDQQFDEIVAAFNHGLRVRTQSDATLYT